MKELFGYSIPVGGSGDTKLHPVCAAGYLPESWDRSV
jgi:hypothetical protein